MFSCRLYRPTRLRQEQVCLLVSFSRHPDQPATNFFAAYIHFPLVSILVQLAVFGEAMLVRYNAIRQKDEVLVLLPGGICLCTDMSKTPRRRTNAATSPDGMRIASG